MGRSRNRPSPLIEPPAHGCGYTNFEFVSASDGQCGAICCRKPSYHAGRDQQPAVRLDRDKEPEIMERLHDIVAEPNTGSGHVHCVCHADDGASTTRSGRCQSQVEALGSGRVPPPIIIEEKRNG